MTLHGAAMGPARLPHYGQLGILIGIGILVAVVLVIIVGTMRSRRK